MAYATKYLFKFQSTNGTTREIRVLQDGYSGSVIQRPLGRAPVLKKQQNGPVHGTSLEFYAECNVNQEFVEFYTSDPKEYRVDVYAGSTLLWQGYITPELYSEPDIAPPYDVQVVATDGVGELKLYDFAAQGTKTLRQMLTYLLGLTGLGTDVYLVSSLKPGSGGAGSLLEKTINLDYMVGKTCYETLTYLLDTLHGTITWWGGHWLLVRETNVTMTSGKVRYFNTAGNSALLAGSSQVLGKMYSNPAWPVGQLSTKIVPAKNKVVVQAPWHPVNGLTNPDMASDTGWTKTDGAAYDSTNHAYHLPAASLSALPRISQELSLTGLRVPMTLTGRFTALSADLSLSTLFTAAAGFYVTYTVGTSVYHLERTDDGIQWKAGAMPSLLGYDDSIYTFLRNYDEDRAGAREISIDIPPFVQNASFPAGTLKVYIFGSCLRVYAASLGVVITKGYQDVLNIDNGARGEGDEVEIAFGRVTSDVAYYQAFLQGLLLDSGALITTFSDANFTTAMDYLAFITRDYALSSALPRVEITGTTFLENSVDLPPLVFTKGGLDYWLETFSWDLYNDELEISARTLPAASLTVESETVSESDGSTVSSGASTAGSGAGGTVIGGGGVNYFQIDEDLQTLLEPKPQFDFISPKKGLIFESTPEADVASSPAHLMLRNLGTAQEPNYALYTPYALITGGDQIVGSGTPGGGGGGAGYLYELGDIYHDTEKTKVLRTDGTTPAAVGDVLQLTSLTGGNKWAAVPATDIGRVYSAGTGITINGNTISLTSGVATAGTYRSVTVDTYGRVTAGTNPTTLSGYGITDAVPSSRTVNSKALSSNITLTLDDVADGSSRKLADYLPLTAGDTKPITGRLYIKAQALAWTNANGVYNGHIEVTSSHEIAFYNGTNGYTVYHSGNANKSNVAWQCSNLTAFGCLSSVRDTGIAISSVNATSSSSNAWNHADVYSAALTNKNQMMSFIVGGTTNDRKGIIQVGHNANSYADYLGDLLLNPFGGNVGIGTSSPAYKFHVVGDNTGTYWTTRTDTPNSRIYACHSGGHGLEIDTTASSSSYYALGIWSGQSTLGSGGNSIFYVRADGNVGIGTSSPAYRFTIYSPTSYTNYVFSATGGTGCRVRMATHGGYGMIIDSTSSSSSVWMIRIRAGQSSLESGGNDVFSVMADGKVGIGTNSPGTALHVRGNVSGVVATIENSTNTNAYITFKNTTGSLGHFGCAPSQFLWLNASASVIMNLNNGTLTTTGDQAISSDINLKTNLQDVTYSVEDIAKTRAVTFDWKDGRGKSAGSIAQDWKPLIPELVHGEEGNMTLAYGQIALINSILLAKHETEQDKEIKKLREKVQRLEEDNLRLKARLGLEN